MLVGNGSLMVRDICLLVIPTRYCARILMNRHNLISDGGDYLSSFGKTCNGAAGVLGGMLGFLKMHSENQR